MSETDARDRTGSDRFDDILSLLSLSLGPSREASVSNIDDFNRSIPNICQGNSIVGTPLFERHGYVQVYDFQSSSSKQIFPVLINDVFGDVKQSLSKKYNVPEEYVIVISKTTNTSAVIVDPKCRTKILYLFAICNQYTRKKSCICVDEDMTVSEFINIMTEKQEDQEKSCLFVQGRIVKRSTQKVIDLRLSNFAECKCIQQLPLTITCHYHKTPNEETLYYLDCINTDTVGQVKQNFYQQFENIFPSDLHSNNKIWFSYCKGILKDEDNLLDEDVNEDELGRFFPLLQDKRNITIHYTSSTDSIPVVVIFNDVEKLIVTEKSTTTERLCYEIGKHLKINSHSLKLQLNKTKISDNVLPASLVSFKPHCRIDVKISKKKTFLVNILFPDGNKSSKSVDMYKNDTVLQLKNLLASSIGETNSFRLQLYCGAEMDDEKRLKEYSIGFGEKIDLVVYASRIEVLVRRPRFKEQHIVIDDSCNTTVLQLKTYASLIFSMDVSEMNIIFNGMSLNNEDTLSEAGVRCYDKLFVCSFSHGNRNNDIGMFRMLTLDDEGEVYSDVAVVRHAGMFHVVKDIEKMETLPGHYQRSSQIQAPKKGIRLLKDRPNGDITSMYAQQRFSTFRSDHSGQKLTQDATSQTESPSTSLSLMCTQRQIVPCQNNIYKNTITTFNTAVTTSSPIVPRDRNTLVYFSEEIITTKNQQIHTVQSDGALSDGGVNTNSCFLTHSRSLQDFNSASEMALTPISLQLRQENLSKDELTPIFNIVAEEIGKEWQMLGSCLGLELKDIHKCESEYKDNLSMQALTMLNYWRKQKGRLATKNELIKCLKVRGRTDIAEQLENLQPDVQQP